MGHNMKRADLISRLAEEIAAVVLPHPTRVARALECDRLLFGGAEGVRERYEKRYLPGQELYFAESRPQERAAIVVFNEDVADPRLVIQVQNGKRI